MKSISVWGLCPFQFTPLREGRLFAGGLRKNERHFNSRPSARGDWRHCGRATDSHISIHAPPRGATNPVPVRRTGHRHFNSRPSARGDFPLPLAQARATHFNSRPSARGDCTAWRQLPAPKHFNSRPSARGDVNLRILQIALLISIHAPPRGATGKTVRRVHR